MTPQQILAIPPTVLNGYGPNASPSTSRISLCLASDESISSRT